MTRMILIALVGAVLATACADDSGSELPTSPIGLAPAGTQVIASASGGGHVEVFPSPPVPRGLALRNFAFTAKAYADGSADGEWQIVAGGTILHGDVTCLAVEGSSARIAGVVTDAKFSLSFQPGDELAWEAVDDGEGVDATDETSNLRAFAGTPPGSAEAFCEDGTVPTDGDQPFALTPIDLGNVQVSGSTS